MSSVPVDDVRSAFQRWLGPAEAEREIANPVHLLERGALDRHDLSRLRWVLFGGEVFPTESLGRLMQLLPATAARFAVRDIRDPVQNISGGLSYLRWLMEYYSGKVRLIEQALHSGTELLEIIERTTIGDPEKRLIKPEGLDQKSTDLELVGVELPAGTEHRIRVRKIALLRKLKGSLYAP